MESDCNCPCHFTDDNSEKSKIEELCDECSCPVECCAFSGDCNCPCHQEALEAWCRFEHEAEAGATIQVTSAEEGNSAEESSDDESK